MTHKLQINLFNTGKKNVKIIYEAVKLIALIVIFTSLNPVQANDENIVYVCLADDGTPTYTNNKVGLSNCKPLSGVFVTTIPAFKMPASEKENNTNTTNNTSHISNKNNTVNTYMRPVDFPRENTHSQRQRDEVGRRPILENELRDRESRCSVITRSLRAPLPRLSGETDVAFGQRIAAMQAQVERCNADLAAIRRELTALK
jgi:hypothetical protein